MRLGLVVLDGNGRNVTPEGEVLALLMTTNENGYEELRATIAASPAEANRLYEVAGTPRVMLDGGGAAFEGRLEDVTARSDGLVTLAAYGWVRALADAPYTALWSDTGTARWRIVTDDDVSGQSPEKWELDNNNRLYFAPRLGEQFLNAANRGAWGYQAPDEGERQIAEVEFDYDVDLPTDWELVLVSYDDGWTSGVTEWTFTSVGAPASASVTQTLAGAKDFVLFQVRNNTGGPVTFAGETGTSYAKVTGLRVKTTESTAIYADEIVDDLIAFVSSLNESQLSDGVNLVESPGVDLLDELYEDAYPLDILMRLRDLGDDEDPPLAWEFGVWRFRRLHFRARGSQGMTWHVDVAERDVTRTLEAVANSAYGVYQDADGRTRRTDVAADAGSVARWGMTRRRAVTARTTSATQAAVHRDALLEDAAAPPPAATITVERVFTAAGAPVAGWMVWSGDRVVVRNLPVTLLSAPDNVASFRVGRTEYDAVGDVLAITPEVAPTSLELLVARRGV